MNCYFDTSAFIKLYHDEEGTNALIEFCNFYANDFVLSVAEFTIVEFRSAFWRRVRMGELSADKVRAAFQKVERDEDEINVVSVGLHSVKRAVKLLDKHAKENKFLSLDALQLGAALVSNKTYPVDLFISSDKRLYEVASNYLDCWDPCDQPVPKF